MGGAAPASPGLADVVRGVERLSIQPLVRRIRIAASPGLSRRAGLAREESVSGSPAALRTGDAVRLFVYRYSNSAPDGNVVAAGVHRDVPAAGGAEALKAGVTSCRIRPV